jgi:hypothetical protein
MAASDKLVFMQISQNSLDLKFWSKKYQSNLNWGLQNKKRNQFFKLGTQKNGHLAIRPKMS